MKDYKHLFFDLDNTVTRSKSPVHEDMKKVLLSVLDSGRNITIVSGARVEQAKKQLESLSCYYLGQNGNHAHDGNTSNDLWRRTLSDSEKAEILNHIESIDKHWEFSDPNDLIDDRHCQISYSLIGHNEILEKKEKFDPDFSFRKNLLKKHPFDSETVEVKIGGTTCLDYIQKGKHKGFNVDQFINLMEWEKEHCIYLGDALFDGGNDETVVGVIETFPVENPDGTFNFLNKLLNNKV